MARKIPRSEAAERIVNLTSIVATVDEQAELTDEEIARFAQRLDASLEDRVLAMAATRVWYTEQGRRDRVAARTRIAAAIRAKGG